MSILQENVQKSLSINDLKINLADLIQKRQKIISELRELQATQKNQSTQSDQVQQEKKILRNRLNQAVIQYNKCASSIRKAEKQSFQREWGNIQKKVQKEQQNLSIKVKNRLLSESRNLQDKLLQIEQASYLRQRQIDQAFAPSKASAITKGNSFKGTPGKIISFSINKENNQQSKIQNDSISSKSIKQIVEQTNNQKNQNQQQISKNEQKNQKQANNNQKNQENQKLKVDFKGTTQKDRSQRDRFRAKIDAIQRQINRQRERQKKQRDLQAQVIRLRIFKQYTQMCDPPVIVINEPMEVPVPIPVPVPVPSHMPIHDIDPLYYPI